MFPTPLSVVVPARNEEHNLPTLLRSLAAQPGNRPEIIVVDDGSTDRTAARAREEGATVIASRPLPQGWRGKTWACHQGAEVAEGDWLLFLDADTWLEPNGLRAILAAGTQNGGGAFSVGPYHAVRQPYEQLSLFFNLNMIAGTVPSGLFGPMLLIDRASYQRVGGHASVRGRILENVRFASECRAAGVPTRSAIGRGLLSFRMYPNGLRELIEGWTKGFASGAGQTPRVTLLLLIGWMVGLMLPPLLGVATGDWARSGGLYALCAAQVAWVGRQVGTFRWYTGLLYPVPLLFFFAVFARSALRSGKTVRWKGRDLRAD